MSSSFQISALPVEEFTGLSDRSDAELAARGIRRVVADSRPGYPCRVSLEDAEPGVRLLLLTYLHHAVDSPYRASGPIYVREAARQATPQIGEVPTFLRHRLLSYRAYDASGMMCAAEVAGGDELESVVERMFTDGRASYIHVHNARPGCYNCRIDPVRSDA